MKRIVLSATFLISCVLGACASERDVSCDVMWSDADENEIGSTTIIYVALDDVNDGLDMCETDQESHAERPDATIFYTCDCST